jgi:hypothetical protein
MTTRTFFTIASSVFLTIALSHFFRVVIGFDLVIAGWPVPIWVITITFIIAGSLAYSGIKLIKKENKLD